MFQFEILSRLQPAKSRVTPREIKKLKGNLRPQKFSPVEILSPAGCHDIRAFKSPLQPLSRPARLARGSRGEKVTVKSCSLPRTHGHLNVR